MSTAGPAKASRQAPDFREVALGLLEQVLDRGRPLDDAILADRTLDALSDRDRGAARMLTATVLRRRGQIEDLIDHCLDRPLPSRAGRARNCLRIGIAQVLFLGTAPHAALDTTVDLVRRHGLGAYAGLVNAILRRLLREGGLLVARQNAACLNTPSWLWESWSRAYGTAVAQSIATAHLEEPRLDVTVKSGVRHWAEALDAEVLPTGSLRRRSGGRVAEMPGFEDGEWWVQDAAAALPVRLFGDLSGRHVIDLCAAPGGKTAQLAAAGAVVTAIDKSPRRLGLLGENMARLGLEVSRVIGDALSWRPDGEVDAVLLDAPCTATGTIRRHPDVPWLKSAKDVSTMAATQDALLDAAIEMVRPGGLVVYCTCSLQPEEGPERIARLIGTGRRARPVPLRRAEVNGLDELIRDGYLRTLPSHLPAFGGMDGFFAARLRVN